jgi:uncharacterized protein YkwD
VFKLAPFVGRRQALVACVCGFLLAAPALHASDTTASSSGERLVLGEINRVRAAHGVPPLRPNARLQAAARAHSRDMVANGYLGHGDVGRRLQSYGVRGRAMAENIAWATGAQVHAAALVAGWLASPPHRANLLSREFRRVGVGLAVGSFAGNPEAHIVTADFAG